MSTEIKRVLNLGGGPESTTLYLMSSLGILPRLDAAIWADTQEEYAELYDHMNWMQLEAQAIAGIPIIRVSAGNIWDHKPDVMPRKLATGEIVRTDCVRLFKRKPTEDYILNEVLGLQRFMGFPIVMTGTLYCEHWFGLAKHDAGRTRRSDQTWKRNEYPLIGWPTRYLDREWTTEDCREWLRTRFGKGMPEVPPAEPKCVGCPIWEDREDECEGFCFV